nr:hypothetical protein [Tanacetum cinerariifolium]
MSIVNLLLSGYAKRELAISKESVSDTVRWISYGPCTTVVKYDAYNINGYTFRMKFNDGKVYQNSEVIVEAIDLHISKEVATTRQAFYYGVLQEIWVLDYHFRKIPLFKCDWVNHRAGGVKQDTTLRMRTPGRCADKWMNGKNYRKDNHHVFCIYSSDDNKGILSKGPSITSIPKEGPSIAKLAKEPIPKEFLAWYGYDIVKDYLPITEKPILKFIFKSPNPIKRCALGLANVETWDNIVKKYGMRTPGRCVDKSKGKRKIPVTGCVLGLANVTTWDEIEKKIGLAYFA